MFAERVKQRPVGVHTVVRLTTRAILIAKESTALQRDFIYGGCWREEEKNERQVAEADMVACITSSP